MNTANIKFIISIFFLSAFLFLSSGPAIAQQDSSDLENLKQTLKNDYFSVGMLIQNVVDYQPERLSGNNGFSISNARFQIYGELDTKFGYQLQASLTKSPSILDANIYYNFSEQASVKAGLFKSPFSSEFLTGAASIDFVNRSAVVNQLAPNRQIGLELGGALSDGTVQYRAGIFNGNRFGINQNNDNTLLYVGRVQTNVFGAAKSDQKLTLGINGSYEKKKEPSIGNSVQSVFVGNQVLLGSDFRFSQTGFMLSGEFIYSWMESNAGTEFNPYGYYATAGYFVGPKTQFLVRWDSFDADSLGNDSNSVIAGVNIFPTTYSEVQLNYIVPTDQAIDFSQLLLNLQLNF